MKRKLHTVLVTMGILLAACSEPEVEKTVYLKDFLTPGAAETDGDRKSVV